MKKVVSAFLLAWLLAFPGAGAQPGGAASGAPQTLTGILNIIWFDPTPGSGLRPGVDYFLHLPDGQRLALQIDPQTILPDQGLTALYSRPVTVDGVLAAARPGDDALQTLQARAITAASPPAGLQADAPQGIVGAQPWISLLCKFPDYADEPNSLSYFANMYANTTARLDHYWRELSFGQMNIAGSSAYGWVTLPKPRSTYVTPEGFQWYLVFDDCTRAADPYVDFSPYVGVNLMFNTDVGGCWGGGSNASLDGKNFFFVTWESPWGYQNLTVMMHEMGHGFGLPHSSHAQVYDNVWDVMSDTWASCDFSDPPYGCLGQGTIAYHKDRLGWITPAQNIVVSPGQSVTADLDWLGKAAPGANPLMFTIPVSGSSVFYTVEARGYVYTQGDPYPNPWATYDHKFDDYLHPVGDQAILIHQVDPNRGEPAHVVDVDGNGYTGDAGAIFLPGESYTPASHPSITISVLSALPTGFRVRVSYAPAPLNKTSPANAATGVAVRPSLSWTASTGATGYQYCLDTQDNQACDAAWTDAAGTQVVFTQSLKANTSYYWQVRALSPGGLLYGNGSAGAYWRFKTTSAAPPGAFNKSEPAANASGVSLNPTLRWAASSSASAYEYCLDASANSACDTTWKAVPRTEEDELITSLPLFSLAPNTTYSWQVRAVGPGGDTYANSQAWWSFTTLTAPIAFSKTAPANLAAGVPLTPTLSWEPSTDVTWYEYCLDTTPGDTCTGFWTAQPETSAPLDLLEPDTTYYWQVQARGPAGLTAANDSAWWSFRTRMDAPHDFTRIQPAHQASGLPLDVTLVWNASQHATGYRYCLDTTGNDVCDSTWSAVQSELQADLHGLLKNTTYYWQVQASGPGGDTVAAGPWWRFTTADAPAAFHKTGPAHADLRASLSPLLTWTPSAGAESYELCYDTTDDGVCTPWLPVSGGSYTPTNLLSTATTYFWQVRALGPGGQTLADDGAWWRFTTLNQWLIYFPVLSR